MDKPLDELYFTWLYDQVGDTRIMNPNRTYWRMLRLMFDKEFVWFVPNDDNRIADGKDLRYEFVDAAELNDVDLDWVHKGCSMFELFVGLSRRLSFEADGEPSDWFWHMVDNLGLRRFTDNRYFGDEEIDEVLERVIWRTYGYDGSGGLFPLKNPSQDQRKVELWYQLSAYLIERA